ncbi:MAPK/MAK/MRK overlapping kinase (MOK protein kinase) (Renal tumor antigen 1) (RAGE-1), partial [Durusdinium trenchii]
AGRLAEKMHKYKLISKKGEGTFSDVLRAESIKTSKQVAIKCMKNAFKSLEEVNSLREIQALRRLSPHAGIIKLIEVLYDQPTGRLALVFELMEMNVYELIRNRKNYLPETQIKSLMYQLMKAVDHCHRAGIFHRDIKPENILVSGDVLKVADFGSCRGIYSKQPHTEYISTRWYRAPENLLTDGYYGYKMDLFAIGCVMFEVIALFPLFPGTNELDQIERIHNVLGTPPDEILAKFKKYATHIEFNFAKKQGTGIGKLIPHADAICIDLLEKLLAYDPEDRISARQALRHPYFREQRQADKRAEREKKIAKEQEAAMMDAGAADVGAAPHKHKTQTQTQAHQKPRRKRKEGGAHAIAGGVGVTGTVLAGGASPSLSSLPTSQLHRNHQHAFDNPSNKSKKKHAAHKAQGLPSIGDRNKHTKAGKHKVVPGDSSREHQEWEQYSSAAAKAAVAAAGNGHNFGHYQSRSNNNNNSAQSRTSSNNNNNNYQGKSQTHGGRSGAKGYGIADTYIPKKKHKRHPLGNDKKRGHGPGSKKYGQSASVDREYHTNIKHLPGVKPHVKTGFSGYKSNYQSPYSQKSLAKSRAQGIY